MTQVSEAPQGGLKEIDLLYRNISKDVSDYQKAELLIPRLPFTRPIREIAGSYSGQGIWFKEDALKGIQELAESQVTTWFECLNHLAIHGKRVTIQRKDAAWFARILESYFKRISVL